MVVGAVILARRSASRKAAGSGIGGVGGVERGRDRPRLVPSGEAVRELVGGFSLVLPALSATPRFRRACL